MKRIVLVFLLLFCLKTLLPFNIQEINFPSIDIKEYKASKTFIYNNQIFFFFILNENDHNYLLCELYDENQIKLNSQKIQIEKQEIYLFHEVYINPQNEISVVWSSRDNESYDKRSDIFRQKFLMNGNSIGTNPECLQRKVDAEFIHFFNDDSYVFYQYKDPKSEQGKDFDNCYVFFNEKNKVINEYAIDCLSNDGKFYPSSFFIKTDDAFFTVFYSLSNRYLVKFDLKEKNVTSVKIEDMSEISSFNFFKNHIILKGKNKDNQQLLSYSNNLKLIDKRSLNENLNFKQFELHTDQKDNLYLTYLKVVTDTTADYPYNLYLVLEKMGPNLKKISKHTMEFKSAFFLKKSFKEEKNFGYLITFTKNYKNCYIELTNQMCSSIFKSSDFKKLDLIYNPNYVCDIVGLSPEHLDYSSVAYQSHYSHNLINFKNPLIELKDGNVLTLKGMTVHSYQLQTLSPKDSLKILKETVINEIKYKGSLQFHDIVQNKYGYFSFWSLHSNNKMDFYYSFIGKDLQIKSQELLFSGLIYEPMLGIIPVVIDNDSLIVYFGQDNYRNTYEFYFDPNGQFVKKISVPKPGRFNFKMHYKTDNGFMRCYYKGPENNIFYDLYVKNKKVKSIQPLISSTNVYDASFYKDYLTFNGNQYRIYGHEDELIETDPEQIKNINQGTKYKDLFIFSTHVIERGKESPPYLRKTTQTLKTYDIKSKKYQNLFSADYILYTIKNDTLFAFSKKENAFFINIYDLNKGIVLLRSEQIETMPPDYSFGELNLIALSKGLLLIGNHLNFIYQINLNQKITMTDLSLVYNFNNCSGYPMKRYSFKDFEFINIFDQDNRKLKLIVIEK